MKSGYKTTEFWMTVFTSLSTVIIGLLVVFGKITDGEGNAIFDRLGPVIASAAVLAVMVIGIIYTNSRTKLKMIALEKSIAESAERTEALKVLGSENK